MVDYDALILQMDSLAEEENWYVPLLSNVSALLYENLPDLNWAGFYLLRDGELVLGPFQGKVACVRIRIGKGVCGTAVAQNRAVRVENVHEFPGHIACDSASNSELVIPLHLSGYPVGVLDLDSPLFSRFTKADEEGLTRFVQALEKKISFS